MRSLMWLREDLRIGDNPALYNSSLSKDGMISIFFITHKIWQKKDYGNNKIDFIMRNLKELSKFLDKKNIPLLIKHIKNTNEISKILVETCHKYKLDAIYFNKNCDDFSENSGINKISKMVTKEKIKVFSFDDDTILPPGSVLTKKESPYAVYTPFKNHWLNVFAEQKNFKIFDFPKKQKIKLCKSDKIVFPSNNKIDQNIQKIWPAGEKIARKRLKTFLTKNIYEYSKVRDYPAQDSTSRLSPYLAAGVISPRECLKAALAMNNNEIDTGQIGITTWISELIWRDFYKHLAAASPGLYKHEPFKEYTNRIAWSHDIELFELWKRGETGFPIVDAAMRQLNQTGWMHNRLRMVVASFLTKLLFIDWRWGEKYFAEKLIDYDFAANNGGWQWSASTGADSVPYFRIFNPHLQQTKYDSKNDFIEKYCNPKDYDLEPIIDYKKAREWAIRVFKKTAKR